MRSFLSLCMILFSSVEAYDLSSGDWRFVRRDYSSASRTNDVICEMEDATGNSQFPPPVIITNSDGTTTCGCASDIVTGGNTSYTECNTITPSFGQDGYADSGLRQNACALDSNYVAQCGTSCTPNTVASSSGDGTCVPFDSSTYSLQSPTIVYTAKSSSDEYESSTPSITSYSSPTVFTSTSKASMSDADTSYWVGFTEDSSTGNGYGEGSSTASSTASSSPTSSYQDYESSAQSSGSSTSEATMSTSGASSVAIDPESSSFDYDAPYSASSFSSSLADSASASASSFVTLQSSLAASSSASSASSSASSASSASSTTGSSTGTAATTTTSSSDTTSNTDSSTSASTSSSDSTSNGAAQASATSSAMASVHAPIHLALSVIIGITIAVL